MKAEAVRGAPVPMRLLVLAGCLCWQVSAQSGGMEKAYQKAMAEIQSGNWVAARDDLRQAAAIAPTNASVHYDLAVVESHTGDGMDALSELKRALALGLPVAKQQLAQELLQELQQKFPGGPADAKLSNTAPGSLARMAHDFDQTIQAIALSSQTYHYLGSTLETSTRKLWVRRISPSLCKSNVSEGWAGARLDELDAAGIRIENTPQDGEVLVMACQKDHSGNERGCWEDWAWANCYTMDKAVMGKGPEPGEVVPLLDKTYQETYSDEFGRVIRSEPRSFQFMRRYSELAIETTGDEAGIRHGIQLVRQMIRAAGGTNLGLQQLTEMDNASARKAADQAKAQTERTVAAKQRHDAIEGERWGDLQVTKAIEDADGLISDLAAVGSADQIAHDKRAVAEEWKMAKVYWQDTLKISKDPAQIARLNAKLGASGISCVRFSAGAPDSFCVATSDGFSISDGKGRVIRVPHLE